MDTADRSVLRMVADADDLEATRRALTSLGTEFVEGEVLALAMDNRPGALARVLERLAEEHINIEYAYVSAGSEPGRSLGIFHTSNPKVRPSGPERVGIVQRRRPIGRPTAAPYAVNRLARD